MKKKIVFLLAVIACIGVSAFTGCFASTLNQSSTQSSQEQTSSVKESSNSEEEISNPEHEDVELPEVERP